MSVSFSVISSFWAHGLQPVSSLQECDPVVYTIKFHLIPVSVFKVVQLFLSGILIMLY